MSEDSRYWGSITPILIDRIGMILRNGMYDVVKPHGLTGAHAVYLLALKNRDGQTLVELSKYLGLDPSNTNRVIKTLKATGFVIDDRKTANSKKYSVYLTETGKTLASELVKSNCEFLNGCVIGISDDLKSSFKTLLFEIMMCVDPDSYEGECNNAEFSKYKHLKSTSGNRDFLVLPEDWSNTDSKLRRRI